MADYSSQNGSPRPTLRKQYHMCKLIYEVLTRGPERISILLGKCFPLGSVSATAYRCFGHAENARFSHHAMNEKACWRFYHSQARKVIYNLYSGALLLSTTSCTGQGSIWHRRYLVLLPWTPVHIVLHRFVKLATLQRQMYWQQHSKKQSLDYAGL